MLRTFSPGCCKPFNRKQLPPFSRNHIQLGQGLLFRRGVFSCSKSVRWFGGAGALPCSWLPPRLPRLRRSFPFRATYYNVEVLLNTDAQTLSAQAKVDFIAERVSKTLVVELHPDLRISAVRDSAGKTLNFRATTTNPSLWTSGFPTPPRPASKFRLRSNIPGPISSEDDSPTKGVRFASIDKTSAYLLLPARWFPLTDYPANRYTGTFKIIVPDTFAVAGTGKADPPT